MVDASPSALIAEDEPLLAHALHTELASLWPALRLHAPVADGVSAVRQALALQPNILFLDIRMPGQSGLEAAAELAEQWPADAQQPFPLLVFVTAYDQYAVAAFEAQAVDYLLKPVERTRLQRCVQRLQLRLDQRAAARAVAKPVQAEALDEALQLLRGLLAPSKGGLPSARAAVSQPLRMLQVGVGSAIELLHLADVVYFEAADKYVRVLTANREHLIRTPLKELLPQLDAQLFWQIHRGTVVQAGQIASVRRDEAGRTLLTLRQRSEVLVVSRLYAGRFKAM